MSEKQEFPESVHGWPIETQVAILYERTATLSDQFRSLIHWIATAVATIIAGMIIGLFSIASGWIGPHVQQPVATAAMSVVRWVGL
ncbi:MAG: hypothetical protein ACREP9_05045 [Candidatus Dormibacteraceae bacterium]